MKMYILVNENIEMSAGKLAGQVGHAITSYIVDISSNNSLLKVQMLDWYNNHNQTKIILKCKQKKLEELESIGYISVRDLGKTELEPNTITCVNLGILDEDDLCNDLKFVKRLRLYRFTSTTLKASWFYA